jgi:hypothetical protein
LIGNDKESFTIPIQLAKNSLSIASRALIDTGANGLAFINHHLALLLLKHFQTTLVELNDPLRVKGFDGSEAKPIRHVLIVHLLIDGRPRMDVPFLVTDLGKHDVILGRKWLAENRVLPDCHQRRLIWPEERSLKEELVSKHFMTIPRSILKKPRRDGAHQEDAQRRDELMEKEDSTRVRFIPKESTPQQVPTTHGRTYERSQEAALLRMNRTLREAREEPKREEARRPKGLPRDHKAIAKRAAELDIALISAVGFARHTRQREVELCMTTLHEINKRLEELHIPVSSKDPEVEEIKKQLPSQY